MKHKIGSEFKSSEESVLYTSLSLFIILLAFFLVLNSHSEFEETRVGKVLGSVEQTFTARIFDAGPGPSFVADLSKGRGEGFATKDLGEMFRSSIAGVEPYLMPSRGFLSVEITPKDFDSVIKSLATNQVPSTLAAMITRVLGGGDNDVPNLQMEIWIDVNASNVRDQLNQADQFIQNVTARGIAPSRLSVGKSSAVTSDKILLMFRPYSPYGVKR